MERTTSVLTARVICFFFGLALCGLRAFSNFIDKVLGSLPKFSFGREGDRCPPQKLLCHKWSPEFFCKLWEGLEPSRSCVLALLSLLLIISCKQQQKIKPLFELVENSGIQFVNKVTDNDTINILNYRNFYNGGGVATGDINNDGLADVFFTANQGSNKLFLNKSNLPAAKTGFKFEDISAKAGFIDKQQYSTGVVMADINADGWLDIFVCNAGSMHNAALRSNQLFINNKDLTFTESAEKYGLKDSGHPNRNQKN